MLFVPPAVRADGTRGQRSLEARIVGDEPVDHATARPRPLLAPALHASISKTETLLRGPPLMGQFDKELIHLHPIGQEPDRTILLDDPKQDGIFLAPRTGTKRRAGIRGR
jgi:hypothetical protein